MMKAKQRIYTNGNGSDLLCGLFGQCLKMERIRRQIPHNPRLGLSFLTAILIAILICFTACGNRNGMQREDAQVLNLMDRLSPADSIQQDEQFRRNQQVIRKGSRRRALIILAPLRIQASLQGVSGNATLKGWATQVYNIGDGLQMNLFLRRGGTRSQIGSRYFDSGKKAEDRDWIPLEFPLEIGEGEENWLEIEISAGPQGDLVADWFALSSLSLLKSKG